jgi:hypothetical protein
MTEDLVTGGRRWFVVEAWPRGGISFHARIRRNNSGVRSSFVLYIAIVVAGLIAAVAVAIAHG